jgi:O-acetyl-ADP-ribose deacetylase (regulator of RNase III)
MALTNIPHINLLCMEERFIHAFHQALAQHWPETNTTPKPTITILNTSLRQVPSSTKFDLVVSPANSYGRLDGAFDDAISRAFCCPPKHGYDTLTEAAQRVLYERWRGFAPPGTCTLVPFPDELLGENEWGCRWVAICPTMRWPVRVSWDREVVYECVWSLLCQVEGWNRDCKREERIESILITPIATGIGRVSAAKWAEQFVLAMRHFVDALQRPERWGALSWGDVTEEVEEVKATWEL